MVTVVHSILVTIQHIRIVDVNAIGCKYKNTYVFFTALNVSPNQIISKILFNDQRIIDEYFGGQVYRK